MPNTTATPTAPARQASIILDAIEFDFGQDGEYPITDAAKDDLTSSWLSTPIVLELNTNSTTETYTREELTTMVAELITNNSGWIVNSISIEWNQSTVA